MHGTENPILCSCVSSLADAFLAESQGEHNRPIEPVTFLWPLDNPPLRHGVASLEHWLDLNA